MTTSTLGCKRIFLFFLITSGICVARASSPEDEALSRLLSLDKRQISSEQRECHSDCGQTILGAQISDYCQNSTWQDEYEECLECANQFNIWRYYGDQVKSAASGCNLTAVASASVAELDVSSTLSDSSTASVSVPISTATNTPLATSSPSTASTDGAKSGFIWTSISTFGIVVAVAAINFM